MNFLNIVLHVDPAAHAIAAPGAVSIPVDASTVDSAGEMYINLQLVIRGTKTPNPNPFVDEVGELAGGTKTPNPGSG